MAELHKRYEYKVYSSTGQYITTWIDVANEPEFQVVINGGYVEMDVRLARQTINFGESSDVAFGNEVQLWCFDQDAPNGVKIFAGFISRYDPTNDGQEEFVTVYILGFHTLMAGYIHEDSLGGTGVSYNSTQPGTIAKDVINKARIRGLPINWSLLTLEESGTIVSYNFQVNTVQECIDQVLALSPFGWYWYVDPDKNLNLHAKPDQAKHTFTVGKEIFYMQPQKRMENVVNVIYFVGGIPDGQTTALYGLFERPASINIYGRRAIKYTDGRVTRFDTMTTLANNLLDAEQTLEVRTVIRVKDNDYDRLNGYDIESIRIGDTCQIRNYQDTFGSSKWDVMSWDIDSWDFDARNLTEIVMQIVEIDYQPDYVELTISSKIPNVSKRVEDINRNLVNTIVQDAPGNPQQG